MLYILQENRDVPTKVCLSRVYCNTKFQKPALSGAIIVTTISDFFKILVCGGGEEKREEENTLCDSNQI
jgi:hypothetical protein